MSPQFSHLDIFSLLRLTTLSISPNLFPPKIIPSEQSSQCQSSLLLSCFTPVPLLSISSLRSRSEPIHASRKDPNYEWL